MDGVQIEDTSNAEKDPLAIWTGFYKKTLAERQDQLKLLYPHIEEKQNLPLSVADNMIENCIGKLSLPMGLGLNFIINGKPYAIPMVTEEPSVIAAASGAAKTISENGGFVATSTASVMISQVQLLGVADPADACRKINENKAHLISYGNNWCKSMVKRGGGLKDIRARAIKWNSEKYYRVYDDDFDTNINLNEKINIDRDIISNNSHSNSIGDNTLGVDPAANEYMVIVHLHVDVCEAMGANMVNNVAEGLAPKLADLVQARVGMRIVSNLCTERRARASFEIPINKLQYKSAKGPEVARLILEAYAFACEDPFRASTHNKGIMNGIDAAAVALGQDWRAIEAAAHTWAARSGRYQPLTHYRLVRSKRTGEVSLQGWLELPMTVGVRGGAVQSHPSLRYSHSLSGNPSAQELAAILACVGLAQNFAALRAFSVEGGRGHMALHSRNIAIAAGTPTDLISEVSAYMISREQIDIETAQDYLRAHDIHIQATKHRMAKSTAPPSTLFVKLELLGSNVFLNILFETIGMLDPVHMSLKHELRDETIPAVQTTLFFEKGPAWFQERFESLRHVFCLKSLSPEPQRINQNLQMKMKLISILLNIITHRLLVLHFDKTESFINYILADDLNPLALITDTEPDEIKVGFSLILSLWNVFKHNVEANVGLRLLANALLEEQRRVLSCLVRAKKALTTRGMTFELFMSVHIKRLQITMFLLVDLLSFSSQSITWDRINFVLKLGIFFEFESTIGHDFQRFERDELQNAPNAYLFWLKEHKLNQGPAAQQEFINHALRMNGHRKQQLLQAEEFADFFDTKSFLKSELAVRKFYRIDESVLHAKL
jgi:hydroxymethylglutaryl-CoA synthase